MFKGRRRPPSFWWDFERHADGTLSIIIESSVTEGALARFNDTQTKQAEKLIKDLEEGRITIKQLGGGN